MVSLSTCNMELVVRDGNLVKYASPTWNPFYRKDIHELEKFQKRALKLSRTPIESVPLEHRRLEADLGEVYTYISGLNRNNPDNCCINVAAV